MRVWWRVAIVTRVGLDFHVIHFGDEREPHEKIKRERERGVRKECWVLRMNLGLSLVGYHLKQVGPNWVLNLDIKPVSLSL